MKDTTRIAHIVLNRHYKTQANVKGRWVAHPLLLCLVLPKNPKKGVKNQRKRGKEEANAIRVVEPARGEKIKNKYKYQLMAS